MNSQSFDLSQNSNEFYSKWLRGRRLRNMIPVVLLTVFALIFIAFAVQNEVRAASFSMVEVDLVLAGFFGIGAVLLAVTGLLTTQRPATRLDLDSTALSVRFTSGASLRLEWADPRFSVTLRQVRYHTLGGSFRTWFPIFRGRVLLSNAAAEALLAMATRAGLKMEDVPDPSTAAGVATRIHR